VSNISRTPLYRVWTSMKARCYRATSKHYPRYGGRGIRVCERWLNSFAAFAEDMGPRPSLLHSIDRINNDGHYEPENCRWATADVQSRNTSRTRLLEWDGRRMCLTDWAHHLGLVDPATLRRRLKKWGLARALSTRVMPASGEGRPGVVLNAEAVAEMRREHAQGATCAALARKYGVARQTVSDAVNQKKWRNAA